MVVAESCEPVVIALLLVAKEIDGGMLEISAQLLLVGPVYIKETFVYTVQVTIYPTNLNTVQVTIYPTNLNK